MHAWRACLVYAGMSLSQDHENRKMEYDDLVFGEPITVGASGVICKGRWKQWEDGEVAIKQMNIADRNIEKEVSNI